MAEVDEITITLRSHFLDDGRSKLIVAIIISFLLNVIFIQLITDIHRHPPPPKYFAISQFGRITPVIPLNKPNHSRATILQWANRAVIAVFSYGFINYRAELEAASGFFTPEGWNNYLQALNASDFLNLIKTQRLVVSSVATSAPFVTTEGTINGRYAWRIQMSIVVTMQNEYQYKQSSYVISALIVRESSLDSPMGIGIAQLVVQPSS